MTARQPPPPGTPGVYQLRAVLHGVRPLMRLLVPGDASVADVHAVVQTVFGWDGEHLHRFVVHGTKAAPIGRAIQPSRRAWSR